MRLELKNPTKNERENKFIILGQVFEIIWNETNIDEITSSLYSKTQFNLEGYPSFTEKGSI